MPIFAASPPAPSLGTYCRSFLEAFKIEKTLFGQDLFEIQPPINSLNNNVSFDSGLFCKIRSNIGDATDNYLSCHALIALLLFSCGPFAIFFVITLVVVLALESVPQWTWTHIIKPLLVTLSPFLTNNNSTPAVISVLFTFFPVTAIQHVAPNVVEWRISVFPRHLRRFLLMTQFTYHSGLRESTSAA